MIDKNWKIAGKMNDWRRIAQVQEKRAARTGAADLNCIQAASEGWRWAGRYTGNRPIGERRKGRKHQDQCGGSQRTAHAYRLSFEGEFSSWRIASLQTLCKVKIACSARRKNFSERF
jgi:hypothetical protein